MELEIGRMHGAQVDDTTSIFGREADGEVWGVGMSEQVAIKENGKGVWKGLKAQAEQMIDVEMCWGLERDLFGGALGGIVEYDVISTGGFGGRDVEGDLSVFSGDQQSVSWAVAAEAEAHTGMIFFKKGSAEPDLAKSGRQVWAAILVRIQAANDQVIHGITRRMEESMRSRREVDREVIRRLKIKGSGDHGRSGITVAFVSSAIAKVELTKSKLIVVAQSVRMCGHLEV